MPTNANTFNSRVTSEALEKKFRDVFPAQGGAELVQDLFASGVIQPVIDLSSDAEGSVLSQNLQTAWDFATGHQTLNNSSATLINTTGFWLVDAVLSAKPATAAVANGLISITDGLSSKVIWEINLANAPAGDRSVTTFAEQQFVVFLRAGDSLTAQSTDNLLYLDVSYRQIADVNGTLVNPLGFTFS